MEDGRVERVAEFYQKQYEWADWRSRWGDFDPAAASDPHVDVVRRLAGQGPKRILEPGPGTGSTAAALSPADLRLLLEGTDLELAEVEPYADQWYGEPTALDAAMVYLAKLTRR